MKPRSKKKATQRTKTTVTSVSVPKADTRTADQIAANIGKLLSDALDRDKLLTLSNHLREGIDLLMSAEPEKVAQYVLHMAVICSDWLRKHVNADDPHVLKLARTQPYWPLLYYPQMKTVVAPPGVGSEFTAVALKKVGDRSTRTRSVALHILQIVDSGFRLAEHARLAHLAETHWPHFEEDADVFGKTVAAVMSASAQNTVKQWKADVEVYLKFLVDTLDGFAAFLGVTNPMLDATALADYVSECASLPDRTADGAEDAWWSLAKSLLSRFTKDEPEKFKVYDGVAEAKAADYRRRFPGKGDGASSRRAGIYMETKKAFVAIFNGPR